MDNLRAKKIKLFSGDGEGRKRLGRGYDLVVTLKNLGRKGMQNLVAKGALFWPEARRDFRL